MTTRDAAAWFDQLRLPPALRTYTGRPSITIGELCRNDLKGSRHSGQHAMSREELRRYFDGILDKVTDCDLVWPLTCCWPMGHSFSAAVAQHTMLTTVVQSGIDTDQYDELSLGTAAKSRVALGIDDVNLFERGSFEQLCTKRSEIEALDEVWERLGIVGNHEKRTDRERSCTVLGMHVLDGKFLLPKLEKLILIIHALVEIIAKPWTSPKDFASFIGSLTWVMLGNRPTLAAFTGVYGFIRDESDSVCGASLRRLSTS